MLRRMQCSMGFFPAGAIPFLNIMYPVVEGVKGSSKRVSQWGIFGPWLFLLSLKQQGDVFTTANCIDMLSVLSATASQAACSRTDCTHPPPTFILPLCSEAQLFTPTRVKPFFFYLISLFFSGEEWAPEWRLLLLEGCYVRLIWIRIILSTLLKIDASQQTRTDLLWPFAMPSHAL